MPMREDAKCFSRAADGVDQRGVSKFIDEKAHPAAKVPDGGTCLNRGEICLIPAGQQDGGFVFRTSGDGVFRRFVDAAVAGNKRRRPTAKSAFMKRTFDRHPNFRMMRKSEVIV